MFGLFNCILYHTLLGLLFFSACYGRDPGFVAVHLQPNDTTTSGEQQVNITTTVSTPAALDQHRFPAKMDCEQRLLEEAYVCVSKHDIDFNHFLLMAVSTLKEGTNVTQPDIIEGVNMTKFRGNVCRAQKEIMQCIFQAAQALMVTPACFSGTKTLSGKLSREQPRLNDQRYLIKEQMEAILGQYDTFCAQPCRLTLLEDMRSCYKKFGLDTSLFLPTKASGPVIGSDSWEVDTFCKNRQELTACLKSTRDQCPESDKVLSALALDLDTTAKGFDVLCSNTDGKCQSAIVHIDLSLRVNFTSGASQFNVPPYLICRRSHYPQTSWKYFSEDHFSSVAFCAVFSTPLYLTEVIVKHIECDLEAWAQYKDDKCDMSIVNFKRKLHCSLVHKQCQKTHGDTIYSICDSPAQEFLIADSSATRASLPAVLTAYPLLLTLMAKIIMINNS
uniref:Uncharacterized protein n=1 Tax=Biomphalaria glabrata TaxID=6526 RepID=A0A2C9LXH5_BIOGL